MSRVTFLVERAIGRRLDGRPLPRAPLPPAFPQPRQSTGRGPTRGTNRTGLMADRGGGRLGNTFLADPLDNYGRSVLPEVASDPQRSGG